MAIQLSALKTDYATQKEDIADVNDDIFVLWCRYTLDFVYEYLKKTDSERIIDETVYYAETDPDIFTLPTNFQDVRSTSCGLFELDYANVSYDTQTANFTTNKTLTGATSGATGLIYEDTDSGTTGILKVKQVNGVFQDNEIITDSEGGSATVNGNPDYFIVKDKKKLGITGFGSSNEGYYLNRSSVVFTNAKEKSFVFRYAPSVVTLSNIEEYFTLDGTSTGIELIENRHQKYLINAIDVLYEEWDRNASAESVADFKMIRALGEVLSNYSRTPLISEMENPSNYY